MRAVIQRVSRSSVTVDGQLIGQIKAGLLVLLGISDTDTGAEADYILKKVVELRIFADDSGKMNNSLLESAGELLIVSQFTLYGDVRKGRRPSFIKAAPPQQAELLYNYFVAEARNLVKTVQTGQFQARMNVELINDGPVTIIIDSEIAN